MHCMTSFPSQCISCQAQHIARHVAPWCHCPVVVRLPDLQRCTLQVNSLRSHNPNGGISIKGRSETTAEARTSLNAEEKQQQADADYARQLQAKLDAQEARGGARSASAVAVMSVCHVIAFVGTHLPGGALCV